MTDSPSQSSGAFWTGVASTVASGVIIAILGFGVSSLMEGFKSPPLAVVAAQLPVRFGSAFDYATPNDRIYLPDAIRSAFVATQDKMTSLEVQKAHIFDLRKEELADMISWLIAPAKSLQVVRIRNQSNKSVSNVKVKSMFAIGFFVVPETGAYALQKSNYIRIDKIDPSESVTVFIWTTSDISFGLSSTISVLSSDEIVPIRLLPYTDQDISDQLIETQNIPAALFMVFLMFVGACTILLSPFFIFYQTNADFRRRHIKKDEFERMLSDVIALQDQYRPSLNLKSIAESDADG